MMRPALAAALIALACSPSAPAPEPTAESAAETIRTYLDASRDEDWAAMCEVVAAESLGDQTCEASIAEQTRGANAISRAIQARTSFEVADVEIDGDRAQVHLDLQIPDLSGLFAPGGRPSAASIEAAELRQVRQSLPLVWERDGWRVIRRRSPPPSAADMERLREKLEERTDQAVEKLRQREEQKRQQP